MKLKYFLLDVFTDKELAGNPLAVVMKADHVSDELMQKIATEFNLSETVFVRQPRLDYHAAALRIFTAKTELPFAGHPTVGTAVLLGLEQRLSGVRLEEEIGVVTCVIERTGKRSGTAHFSLPQLPERLGEAPSSEAMAEALGLGVEDFGCGDFLPAQWSAGVPFYLVPLRDAAALARIRIERRGWFDVFPDGRNAVYAFTATPEEKSNDFAARMLSPHIGQGEDPATGSAAAALIGLLSDHAPGDGPSDFKLRQGHEMGRPSLISLRFSKQAGKLDRAGIGGSAVVIAEGEMDLSA
ncbi:MAG: PhzF family phenazine biosynthesis protein [Alphaproteobacteria bacterium]|nr:PhzF family phenazine biosynthesis protein [Alphaproteobacteria bacterium]